MVGQCDVAVRRSVRTKVAGVLAKLSGLVLGGVEGLDWALGAVGLRCSDVGNVLILGGLRIGKACSGPGRILVLRHGSRDLRWLC